MLLKRRADRWARAAMLSALATSAVVAHASYPERPVRMVVSSAPSSGPDVIARLVGARLTEAWRQQTGEVVTWGRAVRNSGAKAD